MKAVIALRRTHTLGAVLTGVVAGVLLVATGACVPPPPPGGGGPPNVTPPNPGPSVPNTPGGSTFLAGRPVPGQSYDGSASRVQISADGNWVVYHHGSENLNMVNRPPAGCPKPAQTNTQIYRTNLLNGVTELVSVGVDGCYANDESSFPDVSGDGRFVVYMSKATNVVVPDGNGAQQDIFLKDMATGATTVVDVTTAGGTATGGSSSRPDISDDASTLAYSSDATNLVPGDNNGQGDCFVTKRANLRAQQLVSLSSGGQQLNDFSYRCQLTANGSAMVFASFASNAIAGSALTRGQRIYVRDLGANTTKVVSRRANGQPALASRPDISSNGACVVYQTTEAGVVTADTDTQDDVFMYHMASGKTDILSVDRAGNQVSAATTRVVVNGDCTKVAFVSNSNKMVPEDNNGTRDTFERDLSAGTLFLLSVNSAGQQAVPCTIKPPPTPTTTVPGGHNPAGAEDISTRPSMSDDGKVVVYISDVCGLVPEEPQMAGFDGVIVRWMR
jgi:Tol biopolymer transport system component